jgi:hypothetical protein
METQRKLVECTIDETGRLGIVAMGLVDVPAIEENWIALQHIKLSAVNDERRMIYGPAMIPDKEILRVDAGTLEEYYVVFRKATIESVAHQFFQKNLHHNANIDHKYPVNGVTVVESWIKEGDADKSIALGMNELPDGTWFIGAKVEDDSVWNDIKAGKVRGFSIEGYFSEVNVSLAECNTNEKLFLAEIEKLFASV